MNDQPKPPVKALLVDWQIEVLPEMNGAIFRFLGLPTDQGQAEAKPISPLGMPLPEMKRFHADLGEVIGLMERSPGPSGTAQ